MNAGVGCPYTGRNHSASCLYVNKPGTVRNLGLRALRLRKLDAKEAMIKFYRKEIAHGNRLASLRKTLATLQATAVLDTKQQRRAYIGNRIKMHRLCKKEKAVLHDTTRKYKRTCKHFELVVEELQRREDTKRPNRDRW